MERDPVKMLELVVGMPGVRILGVEATPAVIRIEVESTDDEMVCPRCGAQAELLSTKTEEKVDLPVMGVPSRFVVKRRRQASSVAVSVRAVSRDEVAGARSDR